MRLTELSRNLLSGRTVMWRCYEQLVYRPDALVNAGRLHRVKSHIEWGAANTALQRLRVDGMLSRRRVVDDLVASAHETLARAYPGRKETS